MKHKIAAFLCLLTASAVSGTTPDGVTYQTVKIGEDTYSISCDWLEPNVLYEGTDPMQRPTDLFVKDGVIYYNRRNEKNPDQAFLEYYDPAATEKRGFINVDYAGLNLSPSAFYFVGTDSEGTPYFSSFASEKWSETNPFTIVPIEIADGKAKATKVITLNLIDDWYTDEVFISGSLKNDDFRVIARIKKGDNVKLLSTWGYAEWHYDGAEKSKMPITCANHPFSAGVGIPVGEDKVLFYDAALPYEASDNTEYTYTSPTMCTMDDQGKSTVLSSFDGEIAKHGSGLDIIEYDGKYFMLYGLGFAPAKYGVAYLPYYPNSIEYSQHMWTLGSETVPYSDIEENLDNYYKHNAKPMAIHADRDLSDGLQFYTLTNQRGVAKYTIRKETGPTVGLTEIQSESSAEYYTLEGIKLTEQPTQKGIYICHRGDSTTKIIVK